MARLVWKKKLLLATLTAVFFLLWSLQPFF